MANHSSMKVLENNCWNQTVQRGLSWQSGLNELRNGKPMACQHASNEGPSILDQLLYATVATMTPEHWQAPTVSGLRSHRAVCEERDSKSLLLRMPELMAPFIRAFRLTRMHIRSFMARLVHHVNWISACGLCRTGTTLPSPYEWRAFPNDLSSFHNCAALTCQVARHLRSPAH